MNLLPFVFSFLLVLAVGSSMRMRATCSTVRQEAIIEEKKKAYFSLISKQAKAKYRSLRKKAEKNLSYKKKKKRKNRSLEMRLEYSPYPSSRFNLFPLLHPKPDTPSEILRQQAIRLIQILYQETEWYRSFHDKQLADKIVDGMVASKKRDQLSDFTFDNSLQFVYYKMLQGTNSGYPSLEDYFRIDKNDSRAIRFRYASIPVLKAALGIELFNKVLSAEQIKQRKEENKSSTLTEKELQELVQNQKSTTIHSNKVSQIFSFSNKGKGVPMSDNYKGKVRAIRKEEIC